MKRLFLAVLMLLVPVTYAQTVSTSNTVTWYVRADGGSRYSSRQTGGQCNGQANVSYAAALAGGGGATTNLPCAFNDIRYLWTDFSYNADTTFPGWGWVISGGDTVIVKDCIQYATDHSNAPIPGSSGSCRIGWNYNGSGINDPVGGLWGNNQGSGMPPIPSGTSSAHTRILGVNYASCTTSGAKTLINGGYGTGHVFAVSSSNYVDVQCFDITDHTQCTLMGTAGNYYPYACSKNIPLDDYASDGIAIDQNSTHILFQDLNIHGLTQQAFHGPYGAAITLTRVRMGFNAFAGWGFDDGYATPNGVNALITATDVLVEWTGCNEEYPIVDAIPAISCYDDASGGFGDAWSAQGSGAGGQTSQGSLICLRCTIRYSTKDGFGMNHVLYNTLKITDSQSYGNMGQQWKWSSYDNASITFINNLTVNNCHRLASPMTGAPSTYNTHLGDFCRAGGDGLAIGVGNNTNELIAFNTIVGYSATAIDMSCSSPVSCPSSTSSFTFRNNLFLGYSNPAYNAGQTPGAYYVNTGSSTIVRDHNIYQNMRADGCPTTGFPNELCTDPLLTNEPGSPMTAESNLDNFNFSPASGSPSIGAGVAISGITTDYTGSTRPGLPTVGAIEGGSNIPSLTVTSVNLTETATSLLVGQTGALTASVAPINGITPTGTITFFNGTTSLGAASVNSSGVASLSTSSLSIGAYVVTASYSGDSVYAAAGSNSVSLSITGATTTPPPQTTPQTSTLTLSVSPSPATAGQTIAITGAVTTIGNVSPTGTITFSIGGAVIGSGQLAGSGIATVSTSSLTAGTYTVSASYSGDNAYAASAANPISLTVNPPASTGPTSPSGVSITVGQPMYGFNVIRGSTRRVFATVANGHTNQVTWTVKTGSGQISSNSGSWVDVTAPAKGSSCKIKTSGSQYTVSSGTQFTIEATSVDDPTKSADVTFNVCSPAVEISVVPFYRAVYANQPVDLQSFVLGATDPSVHWAISLQPKGGDGSLTDTTSRDTLFTATVAGRYQLTATSQADQHKSATAIVYVTGHPLPYRVTPNLTEPVDCSVDPSSLGNVYEVGPSQTFKTLAAVPFPTMTAGSTVRLHNEDTTGLHPTEYHEYVQISQAGTADQPIRLCGVPDSAGNLPIIDGANATGRSDDSANVAGLGLVTLHNPSNQGLWPNYSAAAYVVVEGIQLRNAKSGSGFAGPDGSQDQWSDSSAAIRINQGQNTVFVGNDINSNSNGVLSAFNATSAWGSSDVNVLWEGNHIHNNGVTGSANSHQMGLQAWGEVVQFNRIDSYVSGGLGSNIRSGGIQGVIRYNYLGDGPARQIDLVDVQNATAMMSFEGFLSGGASSVHATNPADSYPADRIAAEQEAWNSHFVYGNIYQNSLSTAPIHFGEELRGGEAARKGSLYWYNNTFYQKLCPSCSGTTWTLFDTAAGNGQYLPQTEFQTVQAFNNIVWMDDPAKPAFQFNNYDAFIGVAGKNLLSSNWGSNNTAGGAGTGWVATANSAAYQNAEDLSLHLTGFTSQNLITKASIPFDANTWTLHSAVSGQQNVPTAVCQMPVRFAYLPSLGYVVPRTDSPNVGATDTAAQTAIEMNAVSGNGRYHTRYSTCH